jgi:peptide/nickel transport system substrate-binding protein
MAPLNILYLFFYTSILLSILYLTRKQKINYKKIRAVSKTVIIVAVVIIIVAAGVGLYLYLTAPAPPPPPKIKETLIVGTTDSVQTTLDPAEAYDYFGVNIIQNIGTGLFEYEPGTAMLRNVLAKSYSITDGGKVWIINLVENAKFRDGSEFDANAMAFSLNRTIKLNQDPAFLIGDLIDKIEVTGKYQIKLTLKQPFGEEYTKALLSTWVAYAVNPKTSPMEVVKPPNTLDMIGPYYVSKWEIGQFIELTANPNWFGEKPKTQKIVIKFYKDADSLLSAVKAGELDLAFRTFSPAQVDAVMKEGKLQVVSGPGIAPIRYLVFNVNKEPFNNKLVRQAIAYTIDRERIVNTLFLGKLAQPLYSMVPIGFFGHIDAFKDRYGAKPDIEKAKQLLRQAGYSENNKLKFELWYTPVRYTPVEGDVAAILKEGIEATGLAEVTLKSAEWGTYRTLFKEEKISVWLLGWYPDFLDSDNYVRPFYHSGGNGWLHVNYKNSQIDQLIDEQVLKSGTERENLLKQIQQIAAEDAPIIPLWQEGQFAIAQPYVKGIVLDYSQIFRYWLIYAEVK